MSIRNSAIQAFAHGADYFFPRNQLGVSVVDFLNSTSNLLNPCSLDVNGSSFIKTLNQRFSYFRAVIG